MFIILILSAVPKKKKKTVAASAAGSADQVATDELNLSDSGENLFALFRSF